MKEAIHVRSGPQSSASLPNDSLNAVDWMRVVVQHAWMFVLGGIRLLTERFTAYETARQERSAEMVNQALRLHAAR
jgi:hypothetical protein